MTLGASVACEHVDILLENFLALVDIDYCYLFLPLYHYQMGSFI